MAYLVNALQIPNDLVDRLLLELSPNALKCYLVIVRKTIGWSKEFDAISAGQFCKLTGIKKEETVWVAVKQLKELGLIEDIPVPGKPTQFKVVTQTPPRGGDTHPEKR
ncbi:MAG: replication protein [Sulfuricurvum sp.]|uniref:replication protein n=1 Tax=Sulfuricurvum sp. TaxID=2025608 RepID=UPI0025EC09D3|nr:replication protein [Sulfuricurvum sp.]MCK9373624.1 replication protein [Sulfuricurvum sp.]